MLSFLISIIGPWGPSRTSPHSWISVDFASDSRTGRTFALRQDVLKGQPMHLLKCALVVWNVRFLVLGVFFVLFLFVAITVEDNRVNGAGGGGSGDRHIFLSFLRESALTIVAS